MLSISLYRALIRNSSSASFKLYDLTFWSISIYSVGVHFILGRVLGGGVVVVEVGVFGVVVVVLGVVVEVGVVGFGRMGVLFTIVGDDDDDFVVFVFVAVVVVVNDCGTATTASAVEEEGDDDDDDSNKLFLLIPSSSSTMTTFSPFPILLLL